MSIKNLYEQKEVSYYSHSRKELIPYLPKKISKALDVGCGDGSFGLMLKSITDCTVYGVEPNYNSTIIAKKRLDKVFHCQFDNELLLNISEKFDCIFFNDVLEHLINPSEALILAKKLLNNDGRIIASIPNIRFYPVILSLIRYKDFKYQEAGVLDKTHLRFFTKKSMANLFESCGYEIELIEGINQENFKFLNIANALTLNLFDDMKFPQFVIVSKING